MDLSIDAAYGLAVGKLEQRNDVRAVRLEAEMPDLFAGP